MKDALFVEGIASWSVIIGGTRSRVTHDHCILLGTGLVSDHPYQLKIGGPDGFSTARMTPEQYARLRGVLDELLVSGFTPLSGAGNQLKGYDNTLM